MAALPNPARAARFEVALDRSQPKQVYWLEMGMLALRAIEDHFDVPMGDELQARMRSGGFGDTLAIFQAGLLKHHPGINDAEAAAIMDELGQDGAREVVSEAFDKAFPDAPVDDGKGAGAGAAGDPPSPPNRRTRRAAASAQRSNPS